MSFILGKEMVFKIVDVIYLIVIFAVVFMVVTINVNREINVGEVEANTLIKKALYSEDCFAYKDARTHPLTIDFKKFTKEQINKCINIERFSSRFKLITNENTTDVIDNEARFNIDKKLCSFKNYKCIQLKKPVLVYDNGIKRGVLQVDATIFEG